MTSVQDLGRQNYLSQGVPFSGAMDSLSAQIANLALGNHPNDAVIEFTQSGASFITETDILIAISGGGSILRTSFGELPKNKPLFIPSGTELFFKNDAQGCRSYLAVAGGWDVPEVLESRSTYIPARFGGFEGRCLKANDLLNAAGNLCALTIAIADSLKASSINYPKWSIVAGLFLPVDRKAIRVMRGREFDWFENASRADFFQQTFTLGHNSDRMGYQLTGTQLARKVEDELLSTAVTPGTIQVTNNGNPVLLMASCQTTGGYPRIAQVAAVDLPLCAQLKAGDAISFKEIGWKEAEKLYIQQQLDLRKLAGAIRHHYQFE